MNREILFRGYNTFEGRWVYGYYRPIICKNALGACIFEFDGSEWLQRLVKPETVGQYTGFKDRNGTRIFEGDVVNIQRLTSRIRALIKWTDCTIGIFGKGWRIPDMLTEYNVKGMTVVGNIYDNPELVEV